MSPNNNFFKLHSSRGFKKLEEQDQDDRSEPEAKKMKMKIKSKVGKVEHVMKGYIHDVDMFRKSLLEDLKVTQQNLLVYMREEMAKLDNTENVNRKEKLKKDVQIHNQNNLQLQEHGRDSNSIENVRTNQSFNNNPLETEMYTKNIQPSQDNQKSVVLGMPAQTRNNNIGLERLGKRKKVLVNENGHELEVQIGAGEMVTSPYPYPVNPINSSAYSAMLTRPTGLGLTNYAQGSSVDIDHSPVIFQGVFGSFSGARNSFSSEAAPSRFAIPIHHQIQNGRFNFSSQVSLNNNNKTYF